MINIQIFLASSSELRQDRREFETLIGRKNKELVPRKMFLELVVWEDFLDAVSKTRLQDEYNAVIRRCEIFVMLFSTKVGPYTEEEFETAFDQFKQTGRPMIFTYFKDAVINLSSLDKRDAVTLWSFQQKLRDLGHFQTTYENVDALKLHFSQQLDKLVSTDAFQAAPADLTPPRLLASRKPTPVNLLEQIKPTVPAERVREWLGVPTYIYGNTWCYRYSDTQVEICFNTKDVVTSTVIARCHGQVYRGTGAPWGDFELGLMSVSDLFEMGHTSIDYRSSMRTAELVMPVRVGPPGAWSECFCGALLIHSGVGHLADVAFEWDREIGGMKSNPSETVFNWIGTSSGMEPPMFSWFIEE